MANPKISVIMPAYKAEKYIGEAIESILNQTFKDFELIIINDASPDKTLDIINSYTRNDPRIKVFSNEQNLYIAATRNRGIELAQGKYIVWQDADDIAYPERLAKLYNFMESNPEVGICGSFLEIFDEKNNRHVREYKTTDRDLRSSIFRYSPVSQPSAIIRKECFNKVGLYNLDMPPAEDIEMSFRIGELYEFANLPEPLIKYRLHSNSATFLKLKTMEENTLKSRQKFKNSKSYKFTFYDYVYNALQKNSSLIMPMSFRIHLFNIIRRLKFI